MMVAAAIVGAALVLAIVIVTGSEERGREQRARGLGRDRAGCARRGRAGLGGSALHELLGACCAALSGGRFAESMAHRPAGARSARPRARRRHAIPGARAHHEQEQKRVRVAPRPPGEGGDLAAAEHEL